MSVIAFLPGPHHKSTCSKKIGIHALKKAPHAPIVSPTASNLGFAYPSPIYRSEKIVQIRASLFECEFTSRHVSALIHPILFPLKEVKMCLGRRLSVASFNEESLTGTCLPDLF